MTNHTDPAIARRLRRTAALAAVTGIAVFFFHPQVARLRRAVLLADAVGLGVFVTAGTTTALQHDVPAYTACLIGMTVGIGGGAIRDVLLREIPMVLRKEIYAVAALAGAVVVPVALWLGVPDPWGTVIGSALVVAIRLIALWRHWNAPVPRAGGNAAS